MSFGLSASSSTANRPSTRMPTVERLQRGSPNWVAFHGILWPAPSSIRSQTASMVTSLKSSFHRRSSPMKAAGWKDIMS